MIILFQYEETKVLLTGDAGKNGLSQAIIYANEKGIRLNNCTIVKMPHHGSRKNINPKILDALKEVNISFSLVLLMMKDIIHQ